MIKATWLAGLLFGGCDCGGAFTDDPEHGQGCSDEDGDGWGVGADCRGPDCNDFIAEVHDPDACAAWCDAHPLSPGCPCDADEPATCYTGPAETLGMGPCGEGLMTCGEGPSGQRLWGPCEGQVIPRNEVCNEIDDDCDGAIDDGVTNACGSCVPCDDACFGPVEECAPWGDARTDLVETAEGWLTLDGQASTLHVVWPSSTWTGQVLRVSTQTLEIEGAYYTGPSHGVDSPSRTAVDDEGSVVVANRAFGTQGSITKVASDESLCPDSNENGRIDTSSGWDDLLAFDDHETWEDECILWHTTVGGPDAIPRAVALQKVVELDGAARDVGWVGLYNESRFEAFDVETGEVTGIEAPTPGFTPYGAAIDREGWLWATGLADGRVGRFDTSDPGGSFETVTLPGSGMAYRVLVDENDAPWISGNGVWRWNRGAEAFDEVTIATCGGVIPEWGIGTFASDGRGSVWVASYTHEECVYRVTNHPGGDDDFENRAIATPGVRTFGAAVDFDGHAWVFNFAEGNAAVIDLETEEVEVVLDAATCGGSNCLSYPYVRGDATGLQRRNALDPAGRWSGVVEGCPDSETDWKRVLVDGLEPPGSRLEASARTADSLEDLASAPWVSLGDRPADGEMDLDAAFTRAGVTDRALLEVQVMLESLEAAAAPVLRQVDVEWSCAPDIG